MFGGAVGLRDHRLHRKEKTMRHAVARLSVLAMLGMCGSMAAADPVYQNNFNNGVAGAEWSSQKVSAIASPWGSFLGNFGQETVRLTLGQGSGGSGGNGGEPGGGNGGGGTLPSVGGVLTPQPVNGSRSNPFPWGQLGSTLQKTGVVYLGGGDSGGGGGGGGGGNPNPGMATGNYSVFFDLYLFDTWDGLDSTFGVDRFKVAVNGTVLFNEVLETFEPWENRLGGWELPGSHAYSTQFRDLTYRQLEVRFAISDPGLPLTIDFIGAQNQPIWDESWGIDNVSVVYRDGGRAVPTGPTALVLLGGLLAGGRRRR